MLLVVGVRLNVDAAFLVRRHCGEVVFLSGSMDRTARRPVISECYAVAQSKSQTPCGGKVDSDKKQMLPNCVVDDLLVVLSVPSLYAKTA